MTATPRLPLHLVQLAVLGLMFVHQTVWAQRVWHVAQRGEDWTSLAHIYSTTAGELQRLNPQLGGSFSPGDTLTLPALNVQTLARYHTVEPGQTAYAIARLYNLTPAALLAANPAINADKLKAGTVLTIPKAATARRHQVQTGDTFYAIARRYGLSVDQLAAANPQILPPAYTVTLGAYLDVPTSAPTQGTEPLQHIHVAIGLPFDAADASIKNLCLNYYRGWLEASIKLKQRGLNMDIYAFTPGVDAPHAQTALAAQNAHPCQLLVGPYHQNQLPAFESFATTRGALWLVPFDNGSSSLYSNASIFSTQAPASYFASDQTRLLLKHFSGHHVVLSSGTSSADARFATTLASAMKEKGMKISTLKDSITRKTLQRVLSKQQPNVLVCTATLPSEVMAAAHAAAAISAAHPDIRLSFYLPAQSFTTLSHVALRLPSTVHIYIGLPTMHNWTTGEWNVLLSSAHKNFGDRLKPAELLSIALGYDAGLSMLSGIASRGLNFKGDDSNLSPLAAWSGQVARGAALFSVPTHGLPAIIH